MRQPAAALAVMLVLGPPAPSLSDPPSVDYTRREFEAVCERLVASDNLFFGEAMIPWLRDRWETPDLSLDERFQVAERLSHDLHRTGDLDGAVAVLEAMVVALDEAGVAPGDERADMIRIRLGMAHLQRAEEVNCVAAHTPASCILPIAPGAVHRAPKEARLAGDYFATVVASSPERLHTRWLLNIARMVSGDFPEGVPEALRVSKAFFPVDDDGRWPEISSIVGLGGMDLAGGAAMEDFDGDGLLDLVTSSMDPCEPMKAWRNDGRGGFEDVADRWGLSSQLGGLNLVTGDYDNDGMVDILLLRGGWFGADGRIRNSLLRNDLRREAARFVDDTTAGTVFPAYPTQTAAWADYDGDGDLDLYVGNEATTQSIDPIRFRTGTGDAYPSQLFRNNGDGTFTDVTRQAGVQNTSFAKAVAWGDIDNDGDPDLFVSNIGDNRLYRNNGDGTFTDVARAAGVIAPYRSFPSWFFDVDNDGDLDLFVADYGTPVEEVTASYFGKAVEGGHPVLYRNDGRGAFTDVSAEVGFVSPTLPMGANWGDLDNDGWPDLYLGTGVPDFHALVPNVMYRNNGRGGFDDVTLDGAWGHLQKGHGIAFGDLDGDGDQDLFQQLGGAFPFDDYRNALYENPGSSSSWITLRLEGRKANRFGVGARIEVRMGDGDGSRSVHMLAGTGGSFGASSLQQEIGLGPAERIDEIVIQWPGSGTVDRHRDVAVNRYYRAVEGGALEPLEVGVITLGGGADGE